MVAVRFTREYRVAGGAQYRPGEVVEVPGWIANSAIEAGAAIRITSGIDRPPVDKMIGHAPVKK